MRDVEEEEQQKLMADLMLGAEGQDDSLICDGLAGCVAVLPPGTGVTDGAVHSGDGESKKSCEADGEQANSQPEEGKPGAKGSHNLDKDFIGG